MAKFTTRARNTPNLRISSPVQTTGRDITNHAGQVAHARDAKGDLFMLAVVNMVGEKTFYESADTRDARFNSLVHTVTKQDSDWMQRFIPWLRNSANMRTASLVAAVEYVRAGGLNGRTVISSAISRGDEPAETLAYYMSTNSGDKALAKQVKLGVSDAAQRLYNEFNALKYDGTNQAWRMGDVLELTHPKAGDAFVADFVGEETDEDRARRQAYTRRQGDLFKYLLDKRHNRDNIEIPESLRMIERNRNFWAMPEKDRRSFLELPHATNALKDAGITWESLSSWINGPLDARVWESIIPNMGYMALLRNLRNFDEAKIAKSVIKTVQNRIADPEQVRKSRQFPYRFWSAYSNTASDNWKFALGEALDVSTENIPEFSGTTRILVDTSGSMQGFGLSARSKIRPIDAAALFGVALAKKGGDTQLHGFADYVFDHHLNPQESVLTGMKRFSDRIGSVGYGTNIAGALRRSTRSDARIVLISDMQTQSYTRGIVPPNQWLYGFNLGGYAGTQINAGNGKHHEFGGLTDATFRILPLLEKGQSQDWPF